MKKLYKCSILIFAAVLCWGSSANAQCKLDDVFNKFKTDSRCNSVNMSKAMLDIVIKQKEGEHYGRSLSDLKSISSVKILSVKIPRKSLSSGNNEFDFEGASFSEGFYIPQSNNPDTIKAYTTKYKEVAKEKAMARKLKRDEDLKKLKVEYLELGEAFYSEAQKCITAPGYTEMMSVSDKGKQVSYYAQEANGLVKEFVVLTKSSKEFSLIVVKGSDIKISSVSLLGNLIPNADIDLDLN